MSALRELALGGSRVGVGGLWKMEGVSTGRETGPVVWQPGLFEVEPDRDRSLLSFERLDRVDLDATSWLDVIPGWVPHHDELFEFLSASAPWRQRERRMYERTVLEPRLVASWSGDELAALPDRLAEIRSAVSAHYAVNFDSVLINWYRDGRDSVAWHGDTVRKRMDEAYVVTVGLGERRRFLLRPGSSGPATVRLTSGQGDLIVMAGRAQTDWQHTVPKAARAGSRLSITMRHSAALAAADVGLKRPPVRSPPALGNV
jgi:alkylated DNA repair dioxygenase AlkB